MRAVTIVQHVKDVVAMLQRVLDAGLPRPDACRRRPGRCRRDQVALRGVLRGGLQYQPLTGACLAQPHPELDIRFLENLLAVIVLWPQKPNTHRGDVSDAAST
mgnify:CR=1 FL=1